MSLLSTPLPNGRSMPLNYKTVMMSYIWLVGSTYIDARQKWRHSKNILAELSRTKQKEDTKFKNLKIVFLHSIFWNELGKFCQKSSFQIHWSLPTGQSPSDWASLGLIGNYRYRTQLRDSDCHPSVGIFKNTTVLHRPTTNNFFGFQIC